MQDIYIYIYIYISSTVVRCTPKTPIARFHIIHPAVHRAIQGRPAAEENRPEQPDAGGGNREALDQGGAPKQENAAGLVIRRLNVDEQHRGAPSLSSTEIKRRSVGRNSEADRNSSLPAELQRIIAAKHGLSHGASDVPMPNFCHPIE